MKRRDQLQATGLKRNPKGNGLAHPPAVISRRRAPRSRRQAYVIECAIGRGARVVGFAWWDGEKFNPNYQRAKKFASDVEALRVARRAMKTAAANNWLARVIPAPA